MNVDLPDAGRAGDADAHRAAACGQHRGEQRLGLGAVVGAGRLDERDGAGASARRSPSTSPDAARSAPRHASVTASRDGGVRRDGGGSTISAAASGMLVPGPKMAATPARASTS